MPKWKRRPEATSSVALGAMRISGFQVARLERCAFACAEAQGVTEIAFEITIIGADGIEARGEEGSLHRREHLPDVLGKIGAGCGVAPVEAVGEQIILGNQLTGHAERMQDQRAGETGAVLAGGAMDHQRRAVLKQK